MHLPFNFSFFGAEGVRWFRHYFGKLRALRMVVTTYYVAFLDRHVVMVALLICSISFTNHGKVFFFVIKVLLKHPWPVFYLDI